MAFSSKIVDSLTRLTGGGLGADAQRRLRETLDKALGTGLSQEFGKLGSDDQRSACLGAPASFDLRTTLAGLLNGRPVRPARPGTSEPGQGVDRTHVEPYGRRNFKLFVPNPGVKPDALILMLHGCTQTPGDFAAGTRMHALAARANVAVAYPEQPRTANVSLCWNWFEPKDQRRDQGEPGILAGLARSVAAEFGIPPGRLFVAGLSAGGAMAAILAKRYPDLFAGVGIHSGLRPDAAHDIPSAFAAMRNGVPSIAAKGVATTGSEVPAVIFQGASDTTVHPSNADAIVAEIAAGARGLTITSGAVSDYAGRRSVKTVGMDADGRVRIECWMVSGAGHAWFGGSEAGSYTDPLGPDASAEMLRFFLAQIAAGEAQTGQPASR